MLGVIVSKVPVDDHTALTQQLRRKFADTKIPFLGAFPADPILETVRLDEVQAQLGAELIFGSKLQLDQEFDSVIVASQRLEELLEILEEDPDRRPLVGI